MKNKLLLLLLLLLPAWVAWAQAPVWQSVSGITGTATTVRGSALATNGDYYIVGSYTGSADFGNGKSLTSSDQTYTDGFLARINGTTNLCTWAVSMGGTTGADEVRGVAVNGSTVYITGYYNSSASFSNTSNAGSQSLTAVNSSVDVFVAKYDENGNPLGSISGGGTGSDQGYSIAVNGTNIYITGFISTNTTTSTNVKFGTVTLGNSGSQDMFVARFTDNGTLAHGGALSGGGTGLDRGNAIGVGTNGIYVAGYFTAATNATATISGSTLTGAGSNDIYVAKFTDTGSGLNNGLAVRSGGAFSDQGTALTVSGTNIYVGGFFNQNATPGTPATVSISGSTLSSDNRDLFLAKYTDSGSGLSNGYAIRDGGANSDNVGDLALSGSTVYVVGSYTTATTIAGSNLTSNGDDAYVAKYTDTGATFSAIGAIDGGPSAGGAATTGASTVSVSGNQVVLGGFLGSPATFAPAVTGTITVPANNSGFFAKLAQAPVLTSINPNAGPVGTSVTLTGTNLTGATVVTFSGASNNTVTSVTVNGTGTQTITVNVPTGAATGNVTVTTPAGTSNGVVFTVQQPTTVTSIARASTNPTNAATVNYTVTFGAPVTGLTAANFSLTTTGSVSGASVGTPVSTGTGSTWTVPVTTGTGSGTLTLNLANATNLSPGISTPLPFAGETYTIDKTAPTTTISSQGNSNGGTTATTPIPFTVTFSETVTGFVQGDVTVAGGTLSGFSGSGNTYTFNVTPTSSGSTITVNVAANTAQDAAGNGNTAASQFSVTYQQPLVASSQAVTVQLDANGNATLTASSVNNGSSGPGTLTYTIQKVAFGYIPESTTPLTLTTPNGANFTQIRFASYGTPNNNANGNYSLGSCNAANSLAAAQNAYVGRSSGSMYASNTDTRNNPVLGDPCGGTPKALAVQAGYSADAASLTYDCTEAGKTQYVLLTVSNGTSTSTSVAQVTVNAPPAIAISSVSPTSAQRGATVTVSGTNLSGVNSVVVNGATATVSGLSATGFTFVVPNGATLGGGNLTVAAPCAQTLTSTFNVVAPALTATVSTTSASPTSTAPIPFSVSFSQSVGTSFTASDVTVLGGTLTSGSFSGSGAGPYTFTVTPSGTGTVTVSLAANVATDANNTGNAASNSVSVQFQAPTITLAPASLPQGTQNVAYSQTLTASGGTAPYRFAITAGALPNGLTLNLSTGTISGTPTANGTFNFTVTATDASTAPGPYSGARAYTLTISTQPVTAAPVVTAPANGSLTNNPQPTYTGTAPANSTVTVYVGPSAGTASAIGTTTANASGNFSLTQPSALTDGRYQVYATAQTSGSTASANSNTNAFTVDTTVPTATLSSSTVASGGTTSTSPVLFTATFSEPVTGFTAAGIAVTNGTVTSGPTAGSGNIYTFQVTPSAAGNVAVQVRANAAQDQAGNNNPASSSYAFTFQAPTIAITPAALPNGTQGTAYSQALSASGGSGTYSYAITAGALPAGLSLNLSTGTIAGTPTTNGTFNFTVTATDASAAPGPYSGSRSYSLTIAAPAVTAVTWTGNTNTDWFTASNWSPSQVPDATIDAAIPTSPSGGRFPAITSNTANAQVRNLTINSGATLTQTNNVLALAANLTNNGTFQATGGTVILGNTSQSNILGASNTRFWNLTVGSSGAQQSTSASTSVQRVLTLNGNFAINGNPFTLESNANGTAMVVNNGSNALSGNVTVQRYISPDLNPNLGYRHFSSPISSATVASLATGSFSPVVNPAYNTAAIPSQVRPFPTVYGYDQSRLATATNNLPLFDKGWFSPASTADPLTVGQGYTVNLAANQTFSLTGPQNNGNVALNLARNTGVTADDAGLALVGNPYPSPLDWSQVVAADRPGLDGVIYVFTSNDPTNPYAGTYGTYNNGVGNISSVLPLGQGFFVRVTPGQTGATLTFKNSHRPTTYSNTAYRRTAAETRPLVQLSLKGAGSSVSDDAFVYFESGATEGFDPQYDAVKLPNTNGLNLSASVVGKQFSIDGRPEIGSVQRIIPLAVGVPTPGTYSLTSTQLLNLAATPVYLRDVQLGTLTDLRLTPSYQFTVTNASALITGRFELVFSPQKALATVPAALAQQVALYPNPAKKTAFVELPASLGRQAVTATFVDALGRELRTVTLPAQGALAHQLDLTELATGVYALRMSTSAGVVVKKLVVE
ncbi:putative Ig domain-containing protein [Hymenobacter cheonanensis]|uniref:putative Ig domain-containing protein n=1 Tax=Hymenobacter sp. CA2-7 TaxID=3063993 RepID=UPI002713A5C3|nr:putative Ig domain-containing protein [Hymenobacter sp. CA2-7]MDO7886490.1 putative Ig domain-containing protein [Hymenobacter sp. CA2-7]